MYRSLIAIVLLCWVDGTGSSAATTGRRRAVRHPIPAPAPLAVEDSYSLTQGTTLTVAAPGVLANDTLHNATIASFGPSSGAELTTLGSPSPTANGGTLTLSADGGFTYTPASTFAGTDTFRYLLQNAGGSSLATVAIVVRPAPMAAVDDAYTSAPDRAFDVPAPGVLTNDTLAGGRIVSFGPTTGTEQTSLVTTTRTARDGTIGLRQDGSFSYSPPPGYDDGYGGSRPFIGSDSFRYVLRSESGTATAVVHITVDIPAPDADFVVTTPGHYYAISGLSGENPVLQLTRGKTYRFRISVAGAHPFAILDAPPGTVTNNNITEGTLTFTVPLSAQSYRYRCTTHDFGNVIRTVP